MAASTSTKLSMSQSGGGGGPVFQSRGTGTVFQRRKRTDHHTRDDDKETAGAPKPMRQIGKKKSEKGKTTIINASTSPNHKSLWQVSSSANRPKPTEPYNDTPSAFSSSEGLDSAGKITSSPKRDLTSLPPPPSNPPPVLGRDKRTNSQEELDTKKDSSSSSVKEVVGGGGEKKIVSETTQKEVESSKSVGTFHSASVNKFSSSWKKGESDGGQGGRGVRGGKGDRKSPPKHPPPQSPKARAAAVVVMAIQDHIQSSTRSAPEVLGTHLDQKEETQESGEERGVNEMEEVSERRRQDAGRLRAVSAGNKLSVKPNGTSTQKPVPGFSRSKPKTATLAVSPGGGVRSLAQLFGGGERGALSVTASRDKKPQGSPTRSPIMRASAQKAKNARQRWATGFGGSHEQIKVTKVAQTTQKSILQTKDTQPETTPTLRNAGPLFSGSAKDSDHDYQKRILRQRGSFSSSKPDPNLSGASTSNNGESEERHMSVNSNVSCNSPTHTTPTAWCKQSYQNVFSDPAFARFDCTGATNAPSSNHVPLSSSNSTASDNYQNVFDDVKYGWFDKKTLSEARTRAEVRADIYASQSSSSSNSKQDKREEEEGGGGERLSQREKKKPKPVPRKKSNESRSSRSASPAEYSSPSASKLAPTEMDELGDIYEDMQSHISKPPVTQSLLNDDATKTEKVGPGRPQIGGTSTGVQRSKETVAHEGHVSVTTHQSMASAGVSPEGLILGSDDEGRMDEYDKLAEQETDDVGGKLGQFSFQLSDTPWNRKGGGSRGVKGAANRRAMYARTGATSTESVSTAWRKESLGKTVSLNPEEKGVQIRNTSKRQRMLRQGVCSVDEARDSDIDDYIPMNPANITASLQSASLTPPPSLSNSPTNQQPQLQPSPLSQSLPVISPAQQPLPVPIPANAMDPRSSACYLKILPNECAPPPPPTKQSSCNSKKKTAKKQESIQDTESNKQHKYIDIDIADCPEEIFFSVPKKTEKKSTASLPANSRRKLKYSQVEVAPSKTPKKLVVGDKESKSRSVTKYSQVTVSADAAPDGSPSKSSPPQLNRSQGSFLAREMLKYTNRPLPPTPNGVHTYYTTVNHPLPKMPSMRTPVWHEYVEIDEKKLNEMKDGMASSSTPITKQSSAGKEGRSSPIKIPGRNVGGPREREESSKSPTPPPVPQRPSCPYVEIDGGQMEKMAKSLPSSSLLAKLKESDFDTSGSNDSPPTDKSSLHFLPATRNLHRSDATAKHNNSNNKSSTEYSYALIPGMQSPWGKVMTPQDTSQGLFVTTPVQGSHTPMKKSVSTGQAGSLELSHIVGKPPLLPPKSDSLLREQALLSDRPSPYLVPVPARRKMSSPEMHHLSILSKMSEFQDSKFSKEMIGDLRQDVKREPSDGKRSGTEPNKKIEHSSPEHSKPRKRTPPPPRPPPPKLAAQMKRQQTFITVESDEKEEENGQRSYDKEINDKMKHDREGDESSDEEEVVARLRPNLRRVKQSGLRQYINRNSLALIMHNRTAIERQLDVRRSCVLDEGEVAEEEAAKETASGDKESRRGLGEILLEVDSLLQQRMCSEEDLIAAMEQQLKIKLMPVGDAKKSDSGESSRLVGRSGEGGEEEKEAEIEIKVTREDVEKVVTFMDESLSQNENEGEEERNTEIEIYPNQAFLNDDVGTGDLTRNSMIVKSDSELLEEYFPPKQRTSTFVILNDEDLPSLTQRRRQKNRGEKFEISDLPPLVLAANRLDMVPEGDITEMTPSYDLEPQRGGVERMDSLGVDPQSSPERERSSNHPRSSSMGLSPLRRVNARRKTNTSSDLRNLSPVAKHFDQGSGVFTSKGGTLKNSTSQVIIEIPEGAIPTGRRQRLWFEVVQPIQDPLEEEDGLTSSLSELSDSCSLPEVENFLAERRERAIQLTSMVLVGPHEARLLKPLKIKIPHCLSYRNSSWHLQMQARGQNSETDDWAWLSNSSGLVISAAQSRQRVFKESTYQMHPHYAIVRTKELGTFRLQGSPIRRGTRSAKKMVASLYCRAVESEGRKSVTVLVVINNAITDQMQAMDTTLEKVGYSSLPPRLSLLCFGDGKDLELALHTETSGSLPIATGLIPFGLFWRLKRAGQAKAIFTLTTHQLQSLSGARLNLRVQQASSKLIYHSEFSIPSETACSPTCS